MFIVTGELPGVQPHSPSWLIAFHSVYDSQAAVNVAAFHGSNEFQGASEDAGEFRVIVTPRPGHTLTELEATVDPIQKFSREGPTAEEIQKATGGLELNFLRGLESNLGKAEQLLNGAVFHDDPA